MNIVYKPLSYYIERLQKWEPFSMSSFGDGEWLCALKERPGGQNAEGSVYSEALANDLVASLSVKADNYFISTPEDMKHLGLLAPIGKWLKEHGLEIEFHEKDMWNQEFKNGTAGPFLAALQDKRVVIVSNEAYRGLYFLPIKQFVEITYPNAYEVAYKAAEEVLAPVGTQTVILVMAGLAGPVIVRELFKKFGQTACIIEMGSVMDLFVGTGGQRGYRRELYNSTAAVLEWRKKNLNWLYGNAS